MNLNLKASSLTIYLVKVTYCIVFFLDNQMTNLPCHDDFLSVYYYYVIYVTFREQQVQTRDLVKEV